MRIFTKLPLLLLPLAACDDGGPPMSEDTPRQLAVSGDRIVVASSIETETTEFGCGGGEDPAFGPSVMFVSTDRGQTFERAVPNDARPIAKLAVKDGVFYGLAQDASGGFAVLSSADGLTWAPIASGAAMPNDLIANADGIVVAHALGVTVSPDGTTWTEHLFDDVGLYAPSIARSGETIALGSGNDGTLRLSADALEWIERPIAGLELVWQVAATLDGVVVVGLADLGAGAVPAVGRVDLRDPELAPAFRETGGDQHVVLTPAGLLDTAGNLASIDATGIGELVPHVDAFTAGATDGNVVALLRGNTIAVSSDGGASFGAAAVLPIARVPAAIDD